VQQLQALSWPRAADAPGAAAAQALMRQRELLRVERRDRHLQVPSHADHPAFRPLFMQMPRAT
jgi:hypothetical protein